MTKTSRALFALVVFFSTISYAQQNQDTGSSQDGTQSSANGKRVALVIGNSAYENVAVLANPVKDADEIGKALKDLRFEVSFGRNVGTRDEMLSLITKWSATIPANGVALFYYAGHGAQVGGANYLFPVLTPIPNEGNVKQQAVDLELEVLRKITTPDSHTNIVIIDACRTNLRDFQRGLAAVTGSRGTFIAYATSPGKAASDGLRDHGLFTEHLLKHIRTPKLKIEEMFKRVRRDVTADTTNGIGQLPWDASSLIEDFYFKPERDPSGEDPGPVPPKVPPGEPTIRINRIPIYDPVGGDASSAIIDGEISGADPKSVRIVLYSWTDKWYIQPTQTNAFTGVGPDGKWTAVIHTGTRYAALLVKADFEPQYTAFKLPPVGGKVLAATTVVGQQK